MNEKMFELLDFIPVPIYLKDIQGYYLSCNTLFSDMFNVKKEDVVGKNVYDFLDIKTAGIITQKDTELFENDRKEQNFQYKLNTSTGLYDMSFYKNKIINRNGILKGVIGLIFDVSEFKKEKGKKQVENNDFLNLPNSINKLSMIIDSDGKYIDIFTYDKSILSTDKINIIGKYLFGDYGESYATELSDLIKSTINKNHHRLFKEININNKIKKIEIKKDPIQLLVSSRKTVAVVINEVEGGQNYNKKFDFEISRRSKILNEIVNEEYSYEKSFIDMVRSVGIDLRKK